jgi:hypothetical protein
MDFDRGDAPLLTDLAELTPTFSVTLLLVHPDADEGMAFRSLCGFLRKSLLDKKRALSVRCVGEVELGLSDRPDDLDSLFELGIDNLYAVVRERRSKPTWTGESHAEFVEVANQLTLVLRIGGWVLVHTPVTDRELRKFLKKHNRLFQYPPQNVLRNTLGGDGKTLWLHGVHRRRASKADSKTLGGIRVQEVLDSGDATYAMSAAVLDYVPDDEAAVVRGRLTVSPPKARIYWKFRVDMSTFLAAAVETVETLRKSLTDEPENETFDHLAIPEPDLTKVRGAYDIAIADPDEFLADTELDEDAVARIELLRNVFLDVIGDPGSAKFVAVVGHEGAEVGRLAIKPSPNGDAFDLDVRFAGEPSYEAKAREIRDAIGDGDLLSVYYESGHRFGERQINHTRFTAPPFTKQVFADFTGFNVTQEKPRVNGDQAIHDAIATSGDTSLFGWIVTRYVSGWLVCDDGAGEIADFVHLDNGGTLTAIHVKGALNASPDRRVGVTAYQEVVAQAIKNLRSLGSETLVDHFAMPRIRRPAAWRDGVRVTDIGEFVDQLRVRTATDKTRIVIVQPHLLRAVRDAARFAAENGAPTRDSMSLVLLDDLLRTARRAATDLWDDLVVIGSE